MGINCLRAQAQMTSGSLWLWSLGRIRTCLASVRSLKPSSLRLLFGVQVLSASGQNAVFPQLWLGCGVQVVPPELGKLAWACATG